MSKEENDGHIWNEMELTKTLDDIVDKTLGELNQAYFDDKKKKRQDKVTGVAGTIIEESVLKYRPNNDRGCDITVDGVKYEVKTTGIRKDRNGQFTAKECLTITAVSPNDIVNESFSSSHLWDKLEHLLLIYYHYDSKKAVTVQDYAHFEIMGYEFHKFSASDCKRIETDWTLVRNFIDRNRDCPPEQLSQHLRHSLMMIDMAPRKQPRFRLKRSIVNNIVQEKFKPDNKREEQRSEFDSYAAIDAKCNELEIKYSGRTVMELINYFNLKANHPLPKSINERIAVKMFGENVGSINKIEVLSRFEWVNDLSRSWVRSETAPCSRS